MYYLELLRERHTLNVHNQGQDTHQAAIAVALLITITGKGFQLVNGAVSQDLVDFGEALRCLHTNIKGSVPR